MPLQDDLNTLWKRYVAAYRAGDATGCAALFTLGAVLHSPFGPPARGRTEIEALHADWVAEGGGAKHMQLLESGQTGDLAWCLCAFSEGDATGEGVSLNVLERQPDGDWKIRVCSLNAGDRGWNAGLTDRFA
ncbi:nuclear transport factor 2 family protein [Primorskyibacter aestuariivivens]|uniref:YybH family protein n=1 Tax=Primorskyibacter aestuariivivens TaxID=1888912 RepID=UPI0023017073|nr:nuclear transport factor 2 family protein [Primorskyibacter aestuariivivens]MDA7427827.1 nuclear transport factor 2 family protein [Primorskyibacter aestuariivivens]